MKYNPSSFFANFSLAELIKRNQSALGKEDTVVAMGGGSGGFGTGTLSGNSQSFSYNKSESQSFQIKIHREGEREFLASLKHDLENEISTSGAHIDFAHDLAANTFGIQYSEEGIQGKVEISGELSGASYYTVNATFTETSTNEKGKFLETLLQRHRPEGTYYVVAFKPEDPPVLREEFHRIGQRFLQESNIRIMTKLSADSSHRHSVVQNLKYAEVYSWRPVAPEVKQKWEEFIGDELYIPAEYDQFAVVYFLNEVALKLYEDAAVDFEVLKSLSADEMPRLPGPSLRGPYLPAEE